MKKVIFLVLTIFFCFNTYSQTTTTPIKTGQKIEKSLQKEEVHSYSISLDSAQYVYGKAMQRSVDVVVKIKNPKGETVARFDGPAEGPETFQLITKSKGTFTFEISGFENNEGDYSFEIIISEPLATEPDKRVAQIMTPYSGDDVPGAAVLVMKDDEIIFAEGYGMASLTYEIPFKVDTPTNIGSTSKQFTAFAIQLLAEQGKLSLDDDVRKYFPELPDFGKKVTLRNLLTHTSGYREFLNTLAMTGRTLSANLDRKMLVEIVKNQPELQNEPGGEWNYNNTGFALAADIVEKVTDMTFPEWMEKNVFEPLEMNSTMVRTTQNEVVPGRTSGYGLSTQGEYEELQDLGGAMGAGGIYTTLPDLAKWIRNFDDPKVGNKEMLKEMMTPYVLKSGDTTNYGLGLFIDEYRGLKQIHHGGADVAHRSMLMFFPEIDAAVVTQSNYAGFTGNIPMEIANIYFEEYMNVEEESQEKDEESNFEYSSEDFEALTGRYELEAAPGFVLTFKRDGDRIYTQATGQPEFDLKPESDSVFVVKGVNAKVTFHIKENATADSLTLHQNGDHIARKITWQPSVDDLNEYTGKYFSDEIETLYTIQINEDTLVMKNYQIANDLELKPGEKDSFAAEFPISDISFRRNDGNEIIGFSASNGRTRGVFFRKIE